MAVTKPKHLASLIVLAILSAGVTWCAPVIQSPGVVNAASYAASNLPNGSIAQGSMFVVFGTGLGPTPVQVVNSFPIPTSFGGTSIKVTVGGTTVDCLMIYTLATQVAAILPSNTPVGSGTLTLTFQGQASTAYQIKVVKSSFGIFTRNQAGSGPAILQNFVSQTELPVNSITSSARPGQVVILWGTGLGPVTGDEAGGALPGDLTADVQVLLGGRSIPVTYKGRSGCCAGLDQIVFTVPEGIQGCYVPLVVRVNGVVSNFTSIAISPQGGTCSDPLSFSSEDLQKIQSGGNLRAGSLFLSRSAIKFDLPILGSFQSRADIGSGAFNRFDQRLLEASGSIGGTSLIGSCMVVQSTDSTFDDPVDFQQLDAGPALTVTGPKGAKQLTKQVTGGYYGALGGGSNIPGGPPPEPDYLDPGTYTIQGPGGADVGAFTATVVVPQQLVWTNEAQITDVNRSSDLLVTWSGGDPSKEYVTIFGASGMDTTGEGDVVGSLFFCIERNSAGRFTVPSYVLQALPTSPVMSEVPTGLLAVGSGGEGNRFTASGLDYGTIQYSSTTLKSVNYK